MPRNPVAQQAEDAISVAHDPLPGDGDSRLLLADCRSSGSSFDDLVAEAAVSVGVAPRALAVRALLHLPRVACHRGSVIRSEAENELRISAERLRSDVRKTRKNVPRKRFALRQLAFEEIDSCRALPLLTSLHYLRSVREDSRYFALVDPIHRLPVSLCSVSPLEWKRVASQITAQFDIPCGGAWDVSRVYSIDGAPRNAISALLSRVRTYMRRHMSAVNLLVTAVDPNLGFTGSSYRAANWQQWMSIRARPYLYENGHYVSPRQLRERYGTASLNDLQARFPEKFEKSKMRLLDSMIFCSSVNEKTKFVPAHEMRRLRR